VEGYLCRRDYELRQYLYSPGSELEDLPRIVQGNKTVLRCLTSKDPFKKDVQRLGVMGIPARDPPVGPQTKGFLAEMQVRGAIQVGLKTAIVGAS
jgi:hypothetical protein